ncbi:hypothetical protein CRENBAI_001364 [Crenichthys baileyi]|uniref:Uncharacterized protein n=1 Tax=Crenichthys baileyi TaxID=28760 RepID=A0AAV9QVW5_9TELE
MSLCWPGKTSGSPPPEELEEESVNTSQIQQLSQGPQTRAHSHVHTLREEEEEEEEAGAGGPQEPGPPVSALFTEQILLLSKQPNLLPSSPTSNAVTRCRLLQQLFNLLRPAENDPHDPELKEPSVASSRSDCSLHSCNSPSIGSCGDPNQLQGSGSNAA